MGNISTNIADTAYTVHILHWLVGDIEISIPIGTGKTPKKSKLAQTTTTTKKSILDKMREPSE